MIIRILPMQSAQKSSIKRAVKYITDSKDKAERIGSTFFLNMDVPTTEDAMELMALTQSRNAGATGDRTLHLAISFHKEDPLDESVLKTVAQRVLDGLGYGKHQCVAALHLDTDHPHLHLVVNKINPQTYKMVEHWQAFKKVGNVADRLENEFRFTKDPHSSKQTVSAGIAQTMEAQSGEQSLTGFIRNAVMPELSTAENWSEAFETLRAHGLTLKKRANGFIFEDEAGLQVKASTIARSFSKKNLEKRWGPLPEDSSSNPENDIKTDLPSSGKTAGHDRKDGFSTAEKFSTAENRSQQRQASQDVRNGNSRARYVQKPILKDASQEVYAEYLKDRLARDEAQKKRLDALREEAELKRSAISVGLKSKRLLIRSLIKDPLARSVLQGMASLAAKEERQQLKLEQHKARRLIYAETRKTTWVGYLQRKAAEGDEKCILLLRARVTKASAFEISGNALMGTQGSSAAEILKSVLPFDSVTKQGTFIYSNGFESVRDDGRSLQITDEFNPETIEKTLAAARERWGRNLKIQGSMEFKAHAILAAVRAGLDVTFADPVMESRRQALMEQKNGRRNAIAGRIGCYVGSLSRSWGGGNERGLPICWKSPAERRIRQLFYEELGRNVRRHSGISAAQSGLGEPAARASAGGSSGAPLQALPGGKLDPQQGNGQLERDLHVRRTRRNAWAGHLRSGFAVSFDDARRLQRLPFGCGSGREYPLMTSTYGLSDPKEKSCRFYVESRNAKRGEGMHVPEHYRCWPQGGRMEFAGIRHVGRETLLLLREPGEDRIGVCPLSETQLKEEELYKLRLDTMVEPSSGAIFEEPRKREENRKRSFSR